MKIPTNVYPYRLPYTGSKNKIAYQIILTILQKKPKAKYFFDLFGGGASVSLMAVQFGLKVYYTDIDEGIVNLLNFLKDNRMPDSWFRWISREEFGKHLGKTDPESEAIQLCWSFANNRKAYMFGKDKEYLKCLGHKIVCEKDYNALAELNKEFGTNFKMPTEKDRHLRRISFCNQIKKSKKTKLEQLQRLQQLQQLEQLEQLERLDYLTQFKRLQASELPFDEVVVYADPPYRNVSVSYVNAESFNYKEFDEAVKRCKYDVFISEYNCPFEKIVSFGKVKLFNNNKDTKKCISENLYWCWKKPF